MRRRYPSDLLAGASLVLCLAVGGLWAASHIGPTKHEDGLLRIRAADGSEWLRFDSTVGQLVASALAQATPIPGPHWRSPPAVVAAWEARFPRPFEVSVGSFRIHHGPAIGTGVDGRLSMTGNSSYAVVPHWAAAVAFALLPARWLWLRVGAGASGRRSRPDLCRACGYDLRATPDRCPECGAVPAGRR